MGDQRRRGGRGRAGRGGRIPRRGEALPAVREETFVSFPLDLVGPLAVPSALDPEAIEAAFRRTLALEQRQAAHLRAFAREIPEPVLAPLLGEAERHRAALEQLARELGAAPPPAVEAPPPEDLLALAVAQRRLLLEWAVLERIAAASGDRRIDRIAKPTIREKHRHADVLEEIALRRAALSLFRPPEE